MITIASHMGIGFSKLRIRSHASDPWCMNGLVSFTSCKYRGWFQNHFQNEIIFVLASLTCPPLSSASLVQKKKSVDPFGMTVSTSTVSDSTVPFITRNCPDDGNWQDPPYTPASSVNVTTVRSVKPCPNSRNVAFCELISSGTPSSVKVGSESLLSSRNPMMRVLGENNVMSLGTEVSSGNRSLWTLLKFVVASLIVLWKLKLRD